MHSTKVPALAKAYAQHVESLQKQTEKALMEQGVGLLALFAGSLEYFWADDMTKSFRTTPHFQHWLPITSEEHMLLIEPGKKPLLLYFHPNDYWHEHKALEASFWTDYFQIEEHSSAASIQNRAREQIEKSGGTCAWIGPKPPETGVANCSINPPKLVMHLDWNRSFKSEYEILCLKQASELGTKGHLAAKRAFFAGASEREIYADYMKALGNQTALEAPYQPILATDTKAAVLHYHGLQYTKPKYSFLIDAGAQFHGYASDISRTYVLEPEKNKVFSDLIKNMDRIQLELCSHVTAGTKVGSLHLKSHELIAKVLLESGLLRNCSAEEAIEDELTWVFYPHGLGHMLGLQVHDVAGKQLNAKEVCPPVDPSLGVIYRYLRNERTLEDGCVTTIEPGIYFIESLIEKWRSVADKRFDFALFDELKKYGGIRIEDDIVCSKWCGFDHR